MRIWDSRLPGLGALLIAAAAASAVVLVTVSAPARADDKKDAKKEEKPKKSVDADAVYFGDAREWSRPAQLDPDAVYAEIEEYKKILADKIESSDPKYAVLMSQATQRFRAAVRAAAKAGDYDLVAKTGAVHGVDSVPTITQTVIQKL